ncbi:hypothetical protein ACE6H2_004323 [Prunus campanulata]
MYKKLRMLTDFEGATRKNEVRLCIWSSKEKRFEAAFGASCVWLASLICFPRMQ